MPSLAGILFARSQPKDFSIFHDINPRDIDPSFAKIDKRGANAIPSPASSIAFLTVFAIISASMGLLVVWWFVRRGGFVWKEGDWEDYRSSVLRRPGNPNSDIITVFSDGSCKRGGAGSTGTRTIVLSDYDGLSRAEKSVVSGVSRSGVGGWKGFISRLRGGDWESEMTESEYDRRYGGRMKEKNGRGKNVYFDERVTESDARSIQTQEPARVPGWRPEYSERANLDRSHTTKSYYPGDDRAHQRYSHHAQPQSEYSSSSDGESEASNGTAKPKATNRKTARAVSASTTSTTSTSSTSSSDSYESDSDEEEEYGTKVYKHTIERRPAVDLWGTTTENSTGGNYRAGRRGSLSSESSLASSAAH